MSVENVLHLACLKEPSSVSTTVLAHVMSKLKSGMQTPRVSSYLGL